MASAASVQKKWLFSTSTPPWPEPLWRQSNGMTWRRGWSPTDQRGWSPTDQRGWSPTDQRGWSPTDQRGWSPTDQRGWSPTDQRGWSPTDQRGWSPTDQLSTDLRFPEVPSDLPGDGHSHELEHTPSGSAGLPLTHSAYDSSWNLFKMSHLSFTHEALQTYRWSVAVIMVRKLMVKP
ncbi:hypothetical protein RRG08_061601 [Elysia crispata]|uniref:Uncharacterized protein n=1 Tax=Elysia crispata TaxID=231223 RepID=A0AAE1D3Z7_9GAST|nr:hypothetical protein RRG08_061601 [Elysia crispata]